MLNATVVLYMGGRVLRTTTDHQNDMARVKPFERTYNIQTI